MQSFVWNLAWSVFYTDCALLQSGKQNTYIVLNFTQSRVTEFVILNSVSYLLTFAGDVQSGGCC